MTNPQKELNEFYAYLKSVDSNHLSQVNKIKELESQNKNKNIVEKIQIPFNKNLYNDSYETITSYNQEIKKTISLLKKEVSDKKGIINGLVENVQNLKVLNKKNKKLYRDKVCGIEKKFSKSLNEKLIIIEKLIKEKKDLSVKCDEISSSLKNKYENLYKRKEEDYKRQLRDERLKRIKALKEKQKVVKEETIKSLQPEIERILLKSKRDKTEIEERIKLKFKKEREQIEENWRREKNQLRENYENQLSNERKKSQIVVSEEVEKIKRDHQIELKNTKDNFVKQMDLERVRIKNILKQERKLYEDSLNNMASSISNNNSNFIEKKQMNHFIENVKMQHSIEIKKMREEHKAEVFELLKKEELKFSEILLSEKAKIVEKFSNQVKGEINFLIEKVQKYQSDLERKYKFRIEKLMKNENFSILELKNKVNSLERDCEKKYSSIQSLEKTVKLLNNQLNSKKKIITKLENENQQIMNKFQLQIDNLMCEIQVTKRRNETIENQNRMNIESIMENNKIKIEQVINATKQTIQKKDNLINSLEETVVQLNNQISLTKNLIKTNFNL